MSADEMPGARLNKNVQMFAEIMMENRKDFSSDEAFLEAKRTEARLNENLRMVADDIVEALKYLLETQKEAEIGGDVTRVKDSKAAVESREGIESPQDVLAGARRTMNDLRKFKKFGDANRSNWGPKYDGLKKRLQIIADSKEITTEDRENIFAEALIIFESNENLKNKIEAIREGRSAEVLKLNVESETGSESLAVFDLESFWEHTGYKESQEKVDHISDNIIIPFLTREIKGKSETNAGVVIRDFLARKTKEFTEATTEEYEEGGKTKKRYRESEILKKVRDHFRDLLDKTKPPLEATTPEPESVKPASVPASTPEPVEEELTPTPKRSEPEEGKTPTKDEHKSFMEQLQVGKAILNLNKLAEDGTIDFNNEEDLNKAIEQQLSGLPEEQNKELLARIQEIVRGDLEAKRPIFGTDAIFQWAQGLLKEKQIDANTRLIIDQLGDEATLIMHGHYSGNYSSLVEALLEGVVEPEKQHEIELALKKRFFEQARKDLEERSTEKKIKEARSVLEQIASGKGASKGDDSEVMNNALERYKLTRAELLGDNINTFAEEKLKSFEEKQEKTDYLGLGMRLWRQLGDWNAEWALEKANILEKQKEDARIGSKLGRGLLRAINPRALVMFAAAGAMGAGLGALLGYAAGRRSIASLGAGVIAGEAALRGTEWYKYFGKDREDEPSTKKTLKDNDLSEIKKINDREKLDALFARIILGGGRLDEKNPFHQALIEREFELLEKTHYPFDTINDYIVASNEDLDKKIKNVKGEQLKAFGKAAVISGLMGVAAGGISHQVLGGISGVYDWLTDDRKTPGKPDIGMGGMPPGGPLSGTLSPVGHDTRDVLPTDKHLPSLPDAMHALHKPDASEYERIAKKWTPELDRLDAAIARSDKFSVLDIEHLKNLASWENTEVGERARAMLGSIESGDHSLLESSGIQRIPLSSETNLFAALEKEFPGKAASVFKQYLLNQGINVERLDIPLELFKNNIGGQDDFLYRGADGKIFLNLSSGNALFEKVVRRTFEENDSDHFMKILKTEKGGEALLVHFREMGAKPEALEEIREQLGIYRNGFDGRRVATGRYLEALWQQQHDYAMGRVASPPIEHVVPQRGHETAPHPMGPQVTKKPNIPFNEWIWRRFDEPREMGELFVMAQKDPNDFITNLSKKDPDWNIYREKLVDAFLNKGISEEDFKKLIDWRHGRMGKMFEIKLSGENFTIHSTPSDPAEIVKKRLEATPMPLPQKDAEWLRQVSQVKASGMTDLDKSIEADTKELERTKADLDNLRQEAHSHPERQGPLTTRLNQLKSYGDSLRSNIGRAELERIELRNTPPDQMLPKPVDIPKVPSPLTTPSPAPTSTPIPSVEPTPESVPSKQPPSVISGNTEIGSLSPLSEADAQRVVDKNLLSRIQKLG